jgi:hypothetical protein
MTHMTHISSRGYGGYFCIGSRKTASCASCASWARLFGHGSASSLFIATNDGGRVPAATVARIDRDRSGGHTLFDQDDCALGITYMLGRTVVALFPAPPGWQRLFADTEALAVHVEPVLAFALMLDGHVHPLTPSDLSGTASGDIALRHVDQAVVYVDEDGIFDDVDAWLVDRCRRA